LPALVYKRTREIEKLMQISIRKTYLLVGALLLILCASVSSGMASEQPQSDTADDTMLMFVGEADPVVTVASLNPEDPTTAPAIVNVVSREEILRRGYRTLAELLADQPGFFVAAGARGSVPYLRGLRDSILFLYDGVPMTTDVTKSFAPLDREISLFFVERVEIVRGPGSVLWGPDAFAGVVNVVPMHGRQMTGAVVGGGAGNEELFEGHLGIGLAEGKWEGFLGLSGAREEFHSPGYMSLDDQEQIINKDVDPSKYLELVGTLDYDNWLHISGRWSDFTRRYTLRNANETLVWDGEKKTPVNLLKISANKIFGPSHYSLTAYIQETKYEVLDSDIKREQDNRTGHLELLWDRRVLSRGLVTAGASWRHNDVNNALVKDGFRPIILDPDEILFVPRISQKDFTSDIYSVFGQFRYRLDKAEIWLGGRYEDHSDYSDEFSGSLGVQAPFWEAGHVKMTYGTAFRTPYSRQLFEDSSLNQEKISTFSAQLAWHPGTVQNYELTLFHSRLKDHRSEDPYGGLSLGSNLEMYGAELSTRFPLTETLTAQAGLSWVDGSDGEDDYSVFAYSIVRPGGEREDFYDNWSQSYDRGPEWLARISLDWAIAAAHNLRVTASAGGDRDASYFKGTIDKDYTTPVLVDLTYNLPGILTSGRDRLSLRVTNLFDRDYKQPDIYGPVEGEPLRFGLTWEFEF
jgi:outer membrane cobalamin receptor